LNIHLFGAFYGVATSWTLGFFEVDRKKKDIDGNPASSTFDVDYRGSYITDIFAFLGSVLLFIFFPRYVKEIRFFVLAYFIFSAF